MDSQAPSQDKAPLPQNQDPLPRPGITKPPEAGSGRSPHMDQLKQGFHPLPFVKETFARFSNDNSPLIAAALSFYTLVSLAPILMVAVGIFGYFMTSMEARNRVMEFLLAFLPALSESSSLRQDVVQTVEGMLRGAATGPKALSAIAGLLGLVWTASSLFRNMETAFALVFGVEKRRKFVKSVLVALGTMALLGILLLSSIVITSVVQIIQRASLPIANFSAGGLPSIVQVLGYLIPFLLTFGMFIAIYKIVPNACIETRAAAVGAAFSTVFFEAAKIGFGWYVSSFGNFDKTYGALGMVVFLVTWTLYSYMIMLLGAEITDVYSDSALGRPAASKRDEGK